MVHSISLRLWGKYALFTDPVTKIGGEKYSYQIPTYEAIKGILKSIYWKPTIIWYVKRVRVMKPIRSEAKSVKPLRMNASGDSRHELAIYTYLRDVEYQVDAYFDWNPFRPELKQDQNPQKHISMVERALIRGGRQDIYLGTRECQGYVEPCVFGEGKGELDKYVELSFGTMFHSFGYPDETGKNELTTYLWDAVIHNGVITYPSQSECKSRVVKKMTPKKFEPGISLKPIEAEEVS